jgi:hypothetical protein
VNEAARLEDAEEFTDRCDRVTNMFEGACAKDAIIRIGRYW